ncbi:MAG: hypothetical protein ACREDM_11825 [Methylocella sp.]
MSFVFMSFVRLTRLGGSPVAINPGEVVRGAPAPAGGQPMGPLSKGTRIVIGNQPHQDVRGLLDDVIARIGAARPARATAFAALAPVTGRTSRDSRS